MGLRYEPDRIALAEGQALAARRTSEEQPDDREDWAPIDWLHRSRRDEIDFLQLSDQPPPLLVWDELLREHHYWHGRFEETGEKLRELAKKALTSKATGLRRRLRERRDRRELVTVDLLGQYETTGQLTLYSKAIVATAELLSVAPWFLKSVVFIHLSVRALAYEARDLDGQPGYGFAPFPPTSPLHRESPVHIKLAQCFTHRLIERLEDTNLMAAFEKLSQHQPEPYRKWISMKDVPLERLRTLLLRVRASAPALGLPDRDLE